MSALKVVIVDDDPWVLRMVATVLEGRGCRVHTAADGREGYDKVVRVRPDLIVTDVMMPRMDGWTMVRSLRARPDFALVPVIFLTALGGEDDRLHGFRLGADDYLPKPFRFEEFDLRVGNALRRRQEVLAAAAGVREAGPRPAIEGSLDQLGLATLLAMVEMERKSGVLVLHHRGATGRVFCRDGRVVSASIEGGPSGAEAAYRMLGWSHGEFEFSVIPVDMRDAVEMSISHLLLEAARRLDEGHLPSEA